MASRTYAFIDGSSRKNFFESQGSSNLAYWDDPAYYNPASKLKSNTPAYKDNVLEKELLQPQKFGTPYLSHAEITKTVSKQFASDIKERSFARSGSLGKVGFVLVYVSSFLLAAGVMDTITYAYAYVNQTAQCIKRSSDPSDPPQGLFDAAWIWVTAGIWASLLPLILGIIQELSKQTSNADYNHTFDPVLRIDKDNGKGQSANKRSKILAILSIILLILGLICGIIDIYTFKNCASPSTGLLVKFITSVFVVVLCIPIIIVVIVLMRSISQQGQQNSNYDRRNYDMRLDYGLYYSDKADNSNKTEVNTANIPPAVTIPPPQQPSQPLVTIVDPTYPAIMPPPPPPMRPPIFAGPPSLPVGRPISYGPMMYQLPNYNYANY